MRWQPFPIPGLSLNQIQAKLANGPETLSLKEEGPFASLCACLGLQSELGHKSYDRLSLFFGVEPRDYSINPWQNELVLVDGNVGIRFWVQDRHELKLCHEDFRFILHPLSLNERGKLGQILIVPKLVAQHYAGLGLELVIVRDWLLASKEHYFVANTEELNQNSAFIQSQMMVKPQLAFSGTHDISDHLLGWSLNGFLKSRALFQEIHEFYQKMFGEQARPPHKMRLLLSYIIGILLDDLAQPVWYGSEPHAALARKVMQKMASTPLESGPSDPVAKIPESLHWLIADLRGESSKGQNMETILSTMMSDGFSFS